MRNIGWTLAMGGLAALLLTACNKPKTRAAPSDEDMPPAMTAQGKPTSDIAAAAAPDRPAWSGSFMGRPLQSAFKDGSGQCIGYVDKVAQRYQGAPPGTAVVGWAWDAVAKAPIARILLTDESGQVVGAGEGGTPRPDVPAARKEVTSGNTGWAAVTSLTQGAVLAYGITAGGSAACPLGRLQL